MPFFDLPLENRLRIYEYATQEKKKIVPLQTTEGSNKFVWGDSSTERLDNGAELRRPTGKPMTVTQLMRTCRQIYEDLSSYPVFYRANIFVFDSPVELHNFLAAVTPERRHMIRNIELVAESFARYQKRVGWESTDFGNSLRGSLLGHVFTLLCDCQDLRHITFHKYANRFNLTEALTSIMSHSQSTDRSGVRSLWNLPGFDIGLLFHPPYPLNATMSDLSRWSSPTYAPKFSEYISAQKELGSSGFSGCEDYKDDICNAYTALVKYQAQQREARKDNGDPTYPTEQQIYKAVRAADVDFSGETRIDQKRSVGLRDTVSHRTRGRLQAESNVTKMGTIIKETSKYNMTGILVWPISEITDIKWNGQDIECYVSWAEKPYESSWDSWEEIHHFGTYDHLARVITFYNKLYRFGLGRPRERLTKIEEMPRLENIAHAMDGLIEGKKPKGWDERWESEASARSQHIRQLKKRIEILDREEKEKADRKAEAQKQREAEKKKAKAAKKSNKS